MKTENRDWHRDALLTKKKQLRRNVRILKESRLPNGRFKPGVKNRLIWRSSKKLIKAVDQYFDAMELEGKTPTLSGLALSLGVSRKTLYNYKDGQHPEAMEHACNRIEAVYETILVTGKGGSVIGAKYALSNGFGWSERAELNTQNKTIQLSGFRLIPPDQQDDDK